MKKKFDKKALHELYLYIWEKRKVNGRNYSEVSSKYLGKEPLSTYFHHILPKNRYPELIFEEQNIILLTFEEHQEVENGKFFKVIVDKEDVLKRIYGKN